MKSICVLLLLVSIAGVAAGQNQAAIKQAESGCGRFDVKFKVQTNKSQIISPVQAGLAKIYVIEDWDPSDTGRINRPTIRVGMDGKWIGAEQGDSYLFFPATAGEHHLCVATAAATLSANTIVAVYGFQAKSDQTYYFRARTPKIPGGSFALILEKLNLDEAHLLIARYPQATSAVKQ